MRPRRWLEGNCGRPEACRVNLGLELNEVGWFCRSGVTQTGPMFGGSPGYGETGMWLGVGYAEWLGRKPPRLEKAGVLDQVCSPKEEVATEVPF